MKILVVDKNNVKELLEELKTNECFIKFWMDGCGHCDAMKNDWDTMKEELSNEYESPNVAVVDIDSDASSELPVGRTISGFPTIMHTRNGNEVSKYQGERSNNSMKKWILENAPTLKKKRLHRGVHKKTSKMHKSRHRSRNRQRGGRSKRASKNSKRKTKKRGHKRRS